MNRKRCVLMLALAIISVLSVPRSSAVWPSDSAFNVPICTAPGYQLTPRLVSDGSDGAIIVWEDERDEKSLYDVYAQRMDGSGNTSWMVDGVAVCTASGHQTNVAIMSDGFGGVIMTWQDDRGDDWDICVQRIDNSGNARWETDGVIICKAPEYQLLPHIVSDGSSGAIVVWHDGRNGDWDIYAQRIDGYGNTLWMEDGVAICMTSGDQMRASIVSDGSGGAIIAWEDIRDGNWDIYAQRVDGSGDVQWATNGIAICTAPEDQQHELYWQQYTHMLSDDLGGAIIIWRDRRRDYGDIYAQRVDRSGDILWMEDGVAICTALDYQHWPVMVSDGSRGAIVAWVDGRNGHWDIYAQRVDSVGDVLWVDDGVAICTVPGEKWKPTMASDGSGGAIITWTDRRHGPGDIYAQRVDASGNTLWTEDGVAVCRISDNQERTTILGDGSGGAIITWNDYRDGYRNHYDIYAQRVLSDGSLPLITLLSESAQIETLPREFALSQNFPNPFNATTQITFGVPEKSHVRIGVYNILGKLVRELIDGEYYPGFYSVRWDGIDNSGNPVSSGVYCYRMTTGGGVRPTARKMVLLW